ncbi:hypothetical protein D3C79_1041270 [compost metagenome]
MAHGGHAMQRGHRLRHHGAQVGLLPLQLGKRVADMDALDVLRLQLAGLQSAGHGVLHDV